MARALNTSELLTLKKVSQSQKEMSCITKMRNLILFQISSREEFEHLDNIYYHQFWIERIHVPIFHICFAHAFSQVVKRHDDGHPQTRNGEQRADRDRNIGRTSIDRFLVATNDLDEDYYYLSNKDTLSSIEPSDYEEFYKSKFFDVTREFTLRRVFDANYTYFFCEPFDFYLYLKDQIQKSRPVSVLKTILERQIGISFNQKLLLETIILPYYYILPHQDEEEYAEYIRSGHSSGDPFSDLHKFQFVCQLDIAEKIHT
ncbi:uncharacterized protein TNIN_150752 [Trichonephila inaurata madagascariensis]|uniref:Uncharacterized protein n=1 Tax=Trichonephila inaurata madagascariensis TaxID=2747483 RepID=A0A8X6XB25_9ARAC|nr:uncharacterized protein TNIN_150752 [Trichonephila inaurata madagascariensis]